jgi:DNA-binding response OmpR family regulator
MDFVSFSPGETGRVVVAEGNPVTACALSWLLREQGYAVTSVANRDELFAAINRSIPDLILIDDDVLEPDGAVLGALRSDDRWHDVRVIVTAPWAAIEDGAGGLPWGADDCVSEPLRVPELLGRVRTQLRASWQLRAARTALRDTAAELERARDDAVSNRRLVDILHDITGDLSASEIYRLLARRVAEALEISLCSVILARADDAFGTVAAAHADAGNRDVTMQLDEYPEIRNHSPVVRRGAGRLGAQEDHARRAVCRDNSVLDRSRPFGCAVLANGSVATESHDGRRRFLRSRGSRRRRVDSSRSGTRDDARREPPPRSAGDDRSAHAHP